MSPRRWEVESSNNGHVVEPCSATVDLFLEQAWSAGAVTNNHRDDEEEKECVLAWYCLLKH